MDIWPHFKAKEPTEITTTVPLVTFHPFQFKIVSVSVLYPLAHITNASGLTPSIMQVQEYSLHDCISLVEGQTKVVAEGVTDPAFMPLGTAVYSFPTLSITFQAFIETVCDSIGYNSNTVPSASTIPSSFGRTPVVAAWRRCSCPLQSCKSMAPQPVNPK